MKTITCLIVAMALLVATVSFAAQGFNNEQLSFSTATGFTKATLKDTNGIIATQAFCSVEGANVRYWTSATPTASVGILVSSGGWVSITGTGDILNVLFIPVSGTAVMNCQ